MTELTDFQRKIITFLPEIELRFQEPMSRHTSFRIGGAAEVMAFPTNREQLAALLKTSALLDCKPAILGAGTNVLAPDEGMSGLVICLKDCLDGMEQLDGTQIRVMAGVTMSRAAVFAANLGLSGLEFAHVRKKFPAIWFSPKQQSRILLSGAAKITSINGFDSLKPK